MTPASPMLAERSEVQRQCRPCLQRDPCFFSRPTLYGSAFCIKTLCFSLPGTPHSNIPLQNTGQDCGVEDRELETWAAFLGVHPTANEGLCL